MGVPLRVAVVALNDMPGGREPELTDQVGAPVTPLAVKL